LDVVRAAGSGGLDARHQIAASDSDGEQRAGRRLGGLTHDRAVATAPHDGVAAIKRGLRPQSHQGGVVLGEYHAGGGKSGIDRGGEAGCHAGVDGPAPTNFIANAASGTVQKIPGAFAGLSELGRGPEPVECAAFGRELRA
jgi:hypothetical protein